MTFVEQTLSENEKIFYNEKPSLRLMTIIFIIGSLLCLMGIISLVFIGETISLLTGLSLTGAVYMHYVFTEFAVTNKRLTYKSGFFKVKTIEINLNKIETVSVSQGIWGRILNYGTLEISGSGTTILKISYVEDPFGFKGQITKALNTLSKS